MDAPLDAGLHAAPSTEGGAVSATPPSRSEATYRDLKRRLLVGDFPLGQRLGEERLAASFGVSRTPVREALSRLHAEGLVRRHPEGGFCPTAPDLAVIRELYEVRRALEALAITRPAGGSPDHDADALRELRADWIGLGTDLDAADSGLEFVLLDEDFHVRLAAASGNGSVAELLAGVNERIRIVRTHDFLTRARVEATVEQHVGIVETVLRGDLTDAAVQLDAHLAQSMAVVERRALEAIARMVSRSGTGDER
jgi:DNA-binding GntR family transcriptional regulator